jgi:hypothetical protein
MTKLAKLASSRGVQHSPRVVNALEVLHFIEPCLGVPNLALVLQTTHKVAGHSTTFGPQYTYDGVACDQYIPETIAEEIVKQHQSVEFCFEDLIAALDENEIDSAMFTEQEIYDYLNDEFKKMYPQPIIKNAIRLLNLKKA